MDGYVTIPGALVVGLIGVIGVLTLWLVALADALLVERMKR